MVCIVDESGSVGSSNFGKMKQFLMDVVDELDIGPKAFELGFVKFDSSASTEFKLGDYNDAASLKVCLKYVKTVRYRKI